MGSMKEESGNKIGILYGGFSDPVMDLEEEPFRYFCFSKIVS